MAFLAVFAVVCLFSLFGPCSPEPRFGVGVSLPVCHAEIRPLFLKYRVLDVQQWHLIYIYFYYVGKNLYVYTRLLLPKFPESSAMLCLHLSHKDQSDMPEYESGNVFSLQSEQWEHDSGE